MLKIQQHLANNIEITAPQLECDMFLEHILHKDRVSLHLDSLQPVSMDDVNCVMNLVNRRVKGEPIQYILGYREFMGFTMLVEPNVLIPRQDTETLVQAIIERINPEKETHILEWCTGSGCIAVSIASMCKNTIVTACDIDDQATVLAKKNSEKHHVQQRVNIKKLDLLQDTWGEMARNYDIICANPPYIASRDIDRLDQQIKDYEPHRALDGGKDGLVFYKQLAKKSPHYLKKGGFIAMEIGCDQGERVSALLKINGFENVMIIKDLAQLDRVVIGQWL